MSSHGAQQMEMYRVMLCHDTPLCQRLYNSLPRLQFSPSSNTSGSWLSCLVEQRQMQEGWGRVGAGKGSSLVDCKRDQLKTNTELWALGWVRTNHVNHLTYYAAPPWPARVTSASAPKGVKRGSRRREGGSKDSHPPWDFPAHFFADFYKD